MAASVDPGWRIATLALAWCAGLALQMQQAMLWPSAAYLGVALAGAAALGWRALRRHLVLIAAGVAALAFAMAGWRAELRLTERLAPDLEGADLVVTGVVAAMPEFGPSGTRLRFEVERAQHGGREVAVPRRIALGWYRGWHDDALLAGPMDELRAGQRWQLPVRLRQPHGLANPHGFDGELWLWERGLRAGGYVRVKADGPPAQRLADTVAHPVERVRQDVRDAIFRHVADARAAGVLAALAVGDQAAIEREDWEVFRATGVAHLMSISGVHVTMFAWLAGIAIGALWRRGGPTALWWATPWAARWGGLAVAAGYALLAGWGVPAQRTVLMLAAALLLRGLGVRWPWPLVLLAAAVVVTAIDPWAILQAGFWLSFAAVGLLMMSEPAQASDDAARGAAPRWRHTLTDALRSQAVATIGLAPLSMIFFHQVSLVGFAANLLAIPLVTLLVTPLALLGTLAAPLWQPAAWLVQGLSHGLGALAAWPAATWAVPAAPAWAALAGLLAGMLAVLPLPWRLRLLALPLALPLLWPAVPRPAHGEFELVAADVGQGTAALVRTRAHLLVYDSGPQYARDSDAGQRVLLPLLRARGEPRIDLLMISHRDGDHAGGAASLMDGLPTVALSSSIEPGHPLRARARQHGHCVDGQAWDWDGVRFEVLHPTEDDLRANGRPNALSCVLRVTDSAGRSALLTGDIEAPQEAAMAWRHRERLRADVLLVPHHGSRGASSAFLIETVQPRVAVMQAAYRSRFGHPAAEVVARYRAAGAIVVRSDRCGAWTWARGTGRCARTERQRYWHWQAPPQAPDLGADVANPLVAGEKRR